MKKVLLALLLLLLAFLAWEWVTFPDVGRLATETPKTTAFMDLRREQLRDAGKDDHLEYRWVPYERISPYLRRGVLVAEDDAFYEHEGVDVKELQEALKKDWQKKTFSRGGSTITQQLAKNLYLSPSRNPLRKVKELLIARQLERKLTKKRILELYLNVVEYGERQYGAEAAAQHYFGLSAAALSPSQAALLAGCLPNPRILRPDAPNKRLRFRQKMILSRMRRWGYLVEHEVLAEKKPAESEPETSSAPPTATTDTTIEEVRPTDSATPAPPDATAPPPTATDTSSPPPTTSSPPPDQSTSTSPNGA